MLKLKMQVIKDLIPLPREFKIIETLRKLLAKLQHELTDAYNQACY